MIYTEEVLDRATGELKTINTGDWVTVTEFGEMMGVGPRRVRTILREMEFLAVEGGGLHHRCRITAKAVKLDLGRRINPTKKATYPFDVISPAGRAWIGERWSAALQRVEDRQLGSEVQHAKAALVEFQRSRSRQDMPVQEAVCWLADHFPELGQSDVASVLDVTQQLVSRYLNIRSKQRQEAGRSFADFDDGLSSAVWRPSKEEASRLRVVAFDRWAVTLPAPTIG
ncbi:hypothetical protein [Ancylobacter oerskovii]|uniref:Uncharacterized protein n=1 Tax=Ancylobacter oerskovii TaxID=459519 RepID=A0ABW4YZ78_9HYPH|nr:hypothetical protein [Ancylobacter oerskovii]MBS7544025.1 hypothetical protein [Ancylobacter oerskovii]